ncbi:uncharacterized protein EDB93DRAFT_1185446 [Suillus bovinus]|uniref:uncharacterized protein n=1 Tax=Suillus bovinus TaxID=48563 RepID=UPI001B87B16C|nr:uncharacterized protein EDB93DRAFT_1185446 [Suillus bovinus]KAG2128034.1 hypothetical protein EDB93DRAFT_1185446 [Suillus bovinus]
MDQAEKDTKPKLEFLALAEELRSYILSFLPWQDIVRCTFVCKALRQTCIISSELQYIIELGGQRLLPVPIADLRNHTSVSQRLQLLRNKAHAWFQFNLHACSFQTLSIQEQFYEVRTSLADGHFCLWHESEDSEHWAKIIPILPKPSQSTVERYWSPASLCSVPNAYIVDVHMDPTQNLIAIAYAVSHDMTQEGRFYVDLREHLTLKGLGRHLALQCSPGFDDPLRTSRVIWWLQLWDWQHSTTSNSNLSDTMSHFQFSIDFLFVGNNRLLMVSDVLKLYSIEDMSQEPQLLACYSLPFTVMGEHSLLPIDDIAHGSPLQMQAQQTMWTSDIEHRLLCYVTSRLRFVFVISTSIFFDLDSERVGEKAVTIPWQSWGPANTRVFPDSWKVLVSGNRIIQVFPADVRSRYRLHMMDFSPLAVERRQGLGRVVTEPSATEVHESGKTLITSLHYVEVVSDRVFDAVELIGMWLDRDRIYLAKMMDPPDDDPGDLRIDQLEVIEMSTVEY